ISVLRAKLSLSDGAVGLPAGKAQGGRPRDPSAQLLVVDSGSQLGRRLQGVRGGLDRLCRRLRSPRLRQLRQVSDRESERFRRTFAELVAKALEHRGGELRE